MYRDQRIKFVWRLQTTVFVVPILTKLFWHSVSVLADVWFANVLAVFVVTAVSVATAVVMGIIGQDLLQWGLVALTVPVLASVVLLELIAHRPEHCTYELRH